MNTTTWTCIVWSFLTIGFPGLASQRPQAAKVMVNVYNEAEVPTRLLVPAIQEATRIFRKAGVDSLWRECQSPKVDPSRLSECEPPPGHTILSLRIVPWSSKLGKAVFGTAFLSPQGEGTYCDVFYDSVEKLHQDWHVSLSRVLGYTMAHEVGHLLLGTNAHSPIGIMLPSWQKQQLRKIEMGTLLFTPEQARSMQHKLASWTAQNLIREFHSSYP